MAEYIEKGALKREARKLSTHLLNEWDTMGVLALIDRQPAADVAPVRHGRWSESILRSPDGSWRIRGFSCSVCGGLCIGESNYCPNCGAKMDAPTVIKEEER